MQLVTALIYWVVVALWLAVLATIVVQFVRNPRIFGAMRVLLVLLAIDTCRNIIENVYFGLYFGGQFGLLPETFAVALANPLFLIIPKIINVMAGGVVLGLLMMRCTPTAAARW